MPSSQSDTATRQPITLTRLDGIGRGQFNALGTTAIVVTDDQRRIAAATMEVRAELAAIDAACSRFRDDSELEAVNRSNGRLATASPLFCEALDAALRAAEATDGAVDPTVGRSMRANGYDRDFTDVADRVAPVVPFRPAARWRGIRPDHRWGLVEFPPGVSVDLGASAKGLAADRAARRVRRELGCAALVSLGGDVAVAGSPGDRGWNIRVADSHRAGPDEPGQTVRIFSGGLATSSTTVRTWARADGPMHHIVDPRTGRPAKVVWRTVSVHAASCLDANVAATAAIVKGEGAVEWLAGLGLAARLVGADGSTEVVGAWPRDQMQVSA